MKKFLGIFGIKDSKNDTIEKAYQEILHPYSKEQLENEIMEDIVNLQRFIKTGQPHYTASYYVTVTIRHITGIEKDIYLSKVETNELIDFLKTLEDRRLKEAKEQLIIKKKELAELMCGERN